MEKGKGERKRGERKVCRKRKKEEKRNERDRETRTRSKFEKMKESGKNKTIPQFFKKCRLIVVHCQQCFMLEKILKNNLEIKITILIRIQIDFKKTLKGQLIVIKHIFKYINI